MNKYDKALLEKYSKILFGCASEDIGDREYDMLVEYVAEHEPSFLNHRGIIDFQEN